MITIIPSILSDSLEDIGSKLERIRKETHLTRVHIDITDPDYMHELTVSPIDLIELTTHGLSIDVHLMTNDPINDLIECSQVPGIHQVVAQIEHMSSQRAFVEHASSLGLRVGFSIDYTTPTESIEPEIISELASIQVMDVEAGAQGREFGGPAVLERIREVNTLLGDMKLPGVERVADGSINVQTLGACHKAGATTFVVGSYLWKSQDLAGAIAKLQSIA